MKSILITLFAAALLASCVSGGSSSQSSSSSCCSTKCATPTTPDEAIAALKEGNARFVAGKPIFPNSTPARREETINSQKPFACVVACSDSRVPVEMLFDQGLGDIFVIRTAGNSVGSDIVMGSVDYAVDHLEVPLVVILGHQNCGGVTSAIAESDSHHESHGKIDQLLEIVRDDVKPYVGHPEQLDEAIHVNAKVQRDDIEAVKYIQEKESEGKLKVVSAYYSFDTGVVTFD